MDPLAWIKELVSPTLLLTIAMLVVRQSIMTERRFSRLESSMGTLGEQVKELRGDLNEEKEKLQNVRLEFAESGIARKGHSTHGD